MLRSCRNSLWKHTGLSRIDTRYRRVLAVHLQTWHDPVQDPSPNVPLKGLDSVAAEKPVAGDWLKGLPPQALRLRAPRKEKRLVNTPTDARSIDTFFAQLSQLLADEDVSGTTLWHFVQKSCPPSCSTGGCLLTSFEKSLLGQVLDRVLEEWANQDMVAGDVPLIALLRTYVDRNYMRRMDWVYCLTFLAKSAYQKIKGCREQLDQATLSEKVAGAFHLRVLCRAWEMFLVGDRDWHSEPWTPPGAYGNVWPKLRDRQAQFDDAEKGTDFVEHFASATAQQHDLVDTDLERHLAYASILTLVVLYTNLRTFFMANDGALTKRRSCDEGDGSAGGEGGAPETQPNWHLGSEQSTYWTPEIGHLSVNEASILYLLAQTAKDATLNLTLLRINLAQMSLPDSDVNNIARIYQGFKRAVPSIMAKFEDFEHDPTVHTTGLLRRYPFRAHVESAVASNDADALDKACSIVDSYAGAAKTGLDGPLALVNALLQMDRPRQALRYWNLLSQRGDLGQGPWKIWLDYAFEKKDQVAFETAWGKLRTHGIPPTANMWHQRLLLLHQSNQSIAAWEHFCTLVRLSGKNKKLKGIYVRQIAPSTLDNEIFHMMIQAFLEVDPPDVGIAKAKDVLELLKKQEGLVATRETYLLFIQQSLRTNAHQAAIDWFIEGHSSRVKFLPDDYALLFEYDLVERAEDKGRPLCDAYASVGDCFHAISHTMRLVRTRRLYIWTSYQAPQFSSTIEAVLRNMPLVDRVVDDLKDPKLKEIQSLYAGIIRCLSHKFSKQPSSGAKTARLRLLLLLWDHCILIGVPASTQMEALLRSTIYSLHPEMQEKLIRGTMFHNYDSADPVAFYSYRFLRLVGPQWFAERIRSIPPGPTRSRLARIQWNGYDGVTDAILADAGIASQEDRRKILDEVKVWKIEADTKRVEAAEKKEVREKEIWECIGVSKGKAGSHGQTARQPGVLEEPQANQNQTEEPKMGALLKDNASVPAQMQTERRAVFMDLVIK